MLKDLEDELNSVLQFKCGVDKQKNEIKIDCLRGEEYNKVVDILVKHKDSVKITDVECHHTRYQITILYLN